MPSCLAKRLPRSSSRARASRVLLLSPQHWPSCLLLPPQPSHGAFSFPSPWRLLIHAIFSYAYGLCTYILKPVLHVLPTKTHGYYRIPFVYPILKYISFNFFRADLHSWFPHIHPVPLHNTHAHTPHMLSQMIPFKIEFDALSRLHLNLNQTSAAKPSKLIAICQI